jgi:hypothetical protein
LFAGIGRGLHGLQASRIVGVDIAPQYCERLKADHPHVEVVCADALEYCARQPPQCFDIVTIVDGLEHMEKGRGLRLLGQARRLAEVAVYVFVPHGDGLDGFVRNEQHDAWGIPGADEHQLHRSGWTAEEMRNLWFDTVYAERNTTQHGDPYTAHLCVWKREQ